MATQAGTERFDLDERFARLQEIIVNSEKLQLEGQKLSAERLKLDAERIKLEGERLRMETERFKAEAETRKFGVEADLMPRNMIFQAMLAAAALLGAGAAIAKLFFP